MIETRHFMDEDDRRERALVIGGTGLVGRPIVRRLDRAGWNVRVMSRNASRARGTFDARVELMSGDAERSEDLEHVMHGCDVVFVCVGNLLDPYLDLRVTRNVVELAPRMNVERVGLISGASVGGERRYFPMVDAKYQAEQALMHGGTPWVIVRLTWLMESLARFVRGKRATIVGEQPATIHPVAGDDVARMVARALDRREALGHTFTIHGPSAYTMRSWLEEYCSLSHPQVRVNNVPFWVLSIVAALTRNAELEAMIELMKYFDSQPEFGDPREANLILGAPSITLEQWVRSREAAAAA